MKKLINELKWFDRVDWGFFIFLSVVHAALLFMVVSAIVHGASWIVVVLLSAVFVGLVVSFVRASQFAISTNKMIGRRRQ